MRIQNMDKKQLWRYKKKLYSLKYSLELKQKDVSKIEEVITKVERSLSIR